MSALRTVTLPPDRTTVASALEFAEKARRLGAEVLEVRNDLHPDAFPLPPLARVLPVLASERARSLASEWLQVARWIDIPLGSPLPRRDGVILSHHADRSLGLEEARALWRDAPPFALVKHVEPIASVEEGRRLLDVQRALIGSRGVDRVTVLGMGTLALPFRCVLAEDNAFDYLALDASFRAAPGQRLLADAVRAASGSGRRTQRLGILGSRIDHSRSPRIHPPPFDRLDLPEDAPIAELLEALQPFYRGFAVTSPFKRRAAAALGSRLPAVNTLARRGSSWVGANTDVDGARAVLESLGAAEVTVLGRGGVASALEQAAGERGVKLTFVQRGEARPPLRGAVVWTWPAHLAPPSNLRFLDAKVAVIAYGRSAMELSKEIAARGGRPLRLGARWFIAQARAQRALWEAESR